MITRRAFFATAGVCIGTAVAGTAACSSAVGGSAVKPTPTRAPTGKFPFELTDDQWRDRLTAEQFDVLRNEGTERPYSSPLNDEHRPGTFSCAGCDQKLFDAATKFDSGTGWPSFYQHLPDAVGEQPDNSLGDARTEVHCANCGGHLGHVFDDGPKPTGLRYCMDGIAMKFRAT